MAETRTPTLTAWRRRKVDEALAAWHAAEEGTGGPAEQAAFERYRDVCQHYGICIRPGCYKGVHNGGRHCWQHFERPREARFGG